jgi:hypothetical protein
MKFPKLKKIIENNVAPAETITQPLIDAITAELTSAPPIYL